MQTKIPLYRQLRFKVITLFTIVVILVEVVTGISETNLAEREFNRSLHDKFHTTIAMAENFFVLVSQMGFTWGRHFEVEEGITALLDWQDEEWIDEQITLYRDESSADIVILLNDKGRIVAHSEDSSLKTNSLMSWGVVRKALHQQQIEPSIVQDFNSLVIYSPTMLYDKVNGEQRGLVLVGYVINDSMLGGLSKSTLMEVTIVRRRGVMASTFHKGEERLENVPMNYLGYQTLLAQQEDDSHPFGDMRMEGVDYFVEAHNLRMMDPAMDGSIMLSYPKHELEAIKAELLQRTLLISVISIFIIFLLGYRFANRLLLPLHRLVEYTEHSEKNPLKTVQISSTDNDEIAVLAKRFSELLNDINTKNIELKSYSDSLEAMVVERTVKLADSNEALREKDLMLEQAQEIALMGSWEWQYGKDLLLFSEQMYPLLGIDPHDRTLTMQDLINNIHAEDRERVQLAFNNATKSGELDKVEYRIIHSDGYERWMASEGQRIAGIEDRADRLLAITQDITERKQMETLKDEFVSTVSHELRTPLTAIQGSIKLINSGVLDAHDEKRKSMLEIAEKNCTRLLFLINDLLDIEKLEKGSIKLDIIDMPLDLFIDECIAENQAYAHKHSTEIQLINTPGITIHADHQRMKQVMANLLSNACKYSPPDKPVEVTAAVSDGVLTIEVRDYGAGIPKEFQDKIFDKFTMAEGKDNKKVGGTGLGLSIVKRIMELHGGDVSFASEEGQGTRFFVTLPIE